MAAGDIKAGQAYVAIGTNDSALIAGLNRAAQRVQNFGRAVRGIGMQVAGAGAAVFAPLAAASAGYAEHGESLARGSAKTGIAVDSLSTLNYAAQQSGAGTEGLETGLAKMSRTLVEAADGSAQATQALNDLGLSVGDLDKLSQEDRFKLIADRLAAVKDPAQQAAAAMEIFGRGGAELLPMLSQGSAGINQLQQRARALGLQWSTQDAAAAEQLSMRLRDMWDVLGHGADIVGSAVAPVMEALANVVIKATVAATGFIRAHQTAFAAVAAVAVGAVAAGAAIVVLGEVITAAGVVMGTLAAAAGVVMAAIAAIASPLGLVIAGVAGGVAALLEFSNVGATVGNALVQAFDRVWQVIQLVFGNTSNVGDAWAAAQTELGTYLMQAWARVKGFITGLWIDLKSFAGGVFSSIGDEIADAAYASSDAFLNIWAKTMHAWNGIVNAAAKAIQNTFLTTDSQALAADLKRIDDLEKSHKLTHDQAEQQRTAAHKTFDGYDDKQYDQRQKQNDDQLDASLANIKAEADARRKYLDDLRAKQEQTAAAQTQDERDHNQQQVAEATKAAEEARKAFEDQLKKSHAASGQSSLTDQINALLAPLKGATGGEGLIDKIKKAMAGADDVEGEAGLGAGKAPKNTGAFEIANQAVAKEMFGGQTGTGERIAKATEQIAKNTDPKAAGKSAAAPVGAAGPISTGGTPLNLQQGPSSITSAMQRWGTGASDITVGDRSRYAALDDLRNVRPGDQEHAQDRNLGNGSDDVVGMFGNLIRTITQRAKDGLASMLPDPASLAHSIGIAASAAVPGSAVLGDALAGMFSGDKGADTSGMVSEQRQTNQLLKQIASKPGMKFAP